MAGFCTKCGRPLPDDGVCPFCDAPQPAQQPQQPNYQQPQPAPQQPQFSQKPTFEQPKSAPQQPNYQQPAYQQPSYQQPVYQQQPPYSYAPPAPKGPSVFSIFFKNVLSYIKDPVGTSRTLYEKKEFIPNLLIVAANALVVLLGTLFFALVQMSGGFSGVVAPWLIMSIIGVPFAYGLTFGLLFVMGKLAKVPVDPMGLLSVTCINGIIPTVFLFLSMFLGMATNVIFVIIGVLTFAAWITTTFTVLFQVMKVKMNILNMALLIVLMAVIFFGVAYLLRWYYTSGIAAAVMNFFD